MRDQSVPGIASDTIIPGKLHPGEGLKAIREGGTENNQCRSGACGLKGGKKLWRCLPPSPEARDPRILRSERHSSNFLPGILLFVPNWETK